LRSIENLLFTLLNAVAVLFGTCAIYFVGIVVADCELVALLEDDTGMELLVCNKIISLDLPVKDVHRKIWGAEHGEVKHIY